MHTESMNRMSEFVSTHLDREAPLDVLDVGSCCKKNHPTYRTLFDSPQWTYTGLDIEPGENVDIVAEGLYDWGVAHKYDVVISGQCLEHVKDVKLWAEELGRCVKPGGLVCVIAPWKWKQHRYPVDCWRILPDGMTFLLQDVCGFTILDCFMHERDCIGIAHNK